MYRLMAGLKHETWQESSSNKINLIIIFACRNENLAFPVYNILIQVPYIFVFDEVINMFTNPLN